MRRVLLLVASIVLVDTLFFVLLFSVLTTLYDRYRPVSDYRAAAAERKEAEH